METTLTSIILENHIKKFARLALFVPLRLKTFSKMMVFIRLSLLRHEIPDSAVIASMAFPDGSKEVCLCEQQLPKQSVGNECSSFPLMCTIGFPVIADY